jgi:hypothetical protein
MVDGDMMWLWQWKSYIGFIQKECKMF